MGEPDRAECEKELAAIRAAMGTEGFPAAWAEEQAMGANDATAYALRDG